MARRASTLRWGEFLIKARSKGQVFQEHNDWFMVSWTFLQQNSIWWNFLRGCIFCHVACSMNVELVTQHSPLLGDAKLATWVYRPHSQRGVETSIWITHQPILEQVFTFTDIWDMGARSERERGTSHKGEWNQTPEGETQLSLWEDFRRWPWWRVLFGDLIPGTNQDRTGQSGGLGSCFSTKCGCSEDILQSLVSVVTEGAGMGDLFL